MKKIVIHTGFHPEVVREYKGEHIYTVVNKRENVEGFDFHMGNKLNNGTTYYGLSHGNWIKALGDDKYVTAWTDEERWGRVEEIELDDNGTQIGARDLGFMILRVDRANGVL